MNRSLLVACLLAVAAPAVAFAADGPPASSTPVFTTSAPDTVRSSLWLGEALLRDIAREAVACLPADGGRVSLRPQTNHEARELFETAAFDELEARGCEVFLDETDVSTDRSLKHPDADYELRYSIEDLDLSYPRVGRAFGLWRQWIDRKLSATVKFAVIDRASGRVYCDRRVTRSFGDRFDAGDFAAVNGGAFEFASAEPGEGGLRAILEELIVLGALTGLVAVYFANTGG